MASSEAVTAVNARENDDDEEIQVNLETSANSSDSTAVPTYEACHTVLGTAELLEAILLCLPPIKVFEVQRVSKQWQDAIASSFSLQQHMFLCAIPVTEWWTAKAELNQARSILGQDRFINAELMLASTHDYGEMYPFYEDGVLKRYITNSIIPAYACPLLGVAELRAQVGDRYMECCAEEHIRTAVVIEVPLEGFGGTWQNMFLTNPPCKSVVVFFEIMLDTITSKKIEGCKSTRIATGVKFRDVIETIIAIEAFEMEVTTRGQQYTDWESTYAGDDMAEIVPLASGIKAVIAGQNSEGQSTAEVVSSRIEIEVEVKTLIVTGEERELIRNGPLRFGTQVSRT